MFGCRQCGVALTAPLARVALPDHARQSYGHGLLPVLMEAGTYAVDPEPWGPPWRLWSDLGAGEAEARGVFAPVPALSYGVPGAIVVAPGDVHGTVLIPGRCGGHCCGLTGRDGPNLACAHCGREVATRIDDCSLWQSVRLDPGAVRRLPGEAPDESPAGWEALARERRSTPPLEPAGYWDPRWEAAAGVTLAHLLVAAEGSPVALPGGLVTDLFGRALDGFLPPGPAPKTLALAGPGLPDPDPASHLALVPRHPRTGETWQSPGRAVAVPIADDVWMHLAFHNDRLLVPATGVLPRGVLRDDPPPRRPARLFTPDRRVFLDTLARLPALREPWLRRVYDAQSG
ncbi:hypothetical protein [Kitasatospora sp. NBC_01560]|uniref:hypothetical protein n=1 Tax=Kitasatospora sp. NBC_01560 TaxID=2975965 RepID=UPI0038690D16